MEDKEVNNRNDKCYDRIMGKIVERIGEDGQEIKLLERAEEYIEPEQSCEIPPSFFKNRTLMYQSEHNKQKKRNTDNQP
jgi:hypothetical protein